MPRFAAGVLTALAVAAAVNACDDPITPPICCTTVAEPESALVSEPLSPLATGASLQSLSLSAESGSDGGSANVGAAERLVYVSLPSGAYPTGTTAIIRNTSAGPSFGQPMLDGGFDPIAIPAGITFDLYLIRTWDGNSAAAGGGIVAPDLFHLSVADGPTLLNASFAVHPERQQSYPAQHPTDGSAPANNAPHTGALAANALGYDMDAVYRLTFTFTHSAPTVTFRFTAPDLQQLWDESWGLDNVEVTTKSR